MLSRSQAVLVLGAFIAVLVPFDLLRLSNPKLNEWIMKFFGQLMRDEEESRPSAQLYYLMGLLWVALFLPKAVGVQAILTLGWMDPIAAMFGVRFGRNSWNDLFSRFFEDSKKFPIDLGAKTFEGTFAGFLAAVMAGLIAWTGPWAAVDLGTGSLWWPGPDVVLGMSMLGALAASIAEAWPSQWDDNATIPFWTGLVVWTVSLLLNIPLNSTYGI